MGWGKYVHLYKLAKQKQDFTFLGTNEKLAMWYRSLRFSWGARELARKYQIKSCLCFGACVSSPPFVMYEDTYGYAWNFLESCSPTCSNFLYFMQHLSLHDWSPPSVQIWFPLDGSKIFSFLRGLHCNEVKICTSDMITAGLISFVMI